MNIIICDDRIDDRKNVSDLLSDYGEKKNYEFTITEYESGEQLCEEQSALEACQILFLDINMQGMDGLKTAMRIKEKYPTGLMRPLGYNAACSSACGSSVCTANSGNGRIRWQWQGLTLPRSRHNRAVQKTCS